MRTKLTTSNIKKLYPQLKPYEVRDGDIKGFLLRIQPSGAMTYYLSYRTVEGKKKRYKIGRHGSISSTQARDIAIKLSAKSLAGIDIQAEKKQIKIAAEQAKISTLCNFLDQKYGPWIKLERKTGQESINRIKFNFRIFLTQPMSTITSWQIEKWRTEQLEKGKKAETINRDIVALRSCLSKAVDWNLLEVHPLEKLEPLKADKSKKVRYLTKDEESRLRQELINREERHKVARLNANKWRDTRGYELYPDLNRHKYIDHLQPMVILSINTGLRRGELFNLCRHDVDFEQAILTINGSTSKSGKSRHIPLNSEALNILKIWRQQNQSANLVFTGKKGFEINSIRKIWATVLKNAEITNFRWHDLRHHFASKLAMAGVDLNTIRELLGHSDLEMTLRYAHLAPEHKANAVAKLIFE